MRIAINCRSFLKKKYSGIGRYAHNLVSSLVGIDRENDYLLYARRNIFDFKRGIPEFSGKNFSTKVDLFGKGVNKTCGKVDLYHSPSPEFLNVSGVKIITTVHDMIYKTYPRGHTEEACSTLEKQMKDVVNKSDGIICCSQSTIDDLGKFFDVGEDNVKLIYQGVDKTKFYPLDEEEKGEAEKRLKPLGVESPYILFVGTIEPRKNLVSLLKAFSILKKNNKFYGKLVVVGMKGWMMEDLDQQIKFLGIGKDCVFLGHVKDQELRELYNMTEVFVFPSFYEGFGFPIVEAMSCGAAVVASRVSSCKEVAADAAQLIDPHNPEDIYSSIVEILDNRELSNNLKHKALERAGYFSFKNTAEQTLEFYQKIGAE